MNALMSGAPEQVAPWVASFDRLEKGRPPDWLSSIRRGALARFAETGFPTTREEAWRFTNVAPIGRVKFSPAEAPAAAAAREEWLPWLDDVVFRALDSEAAAGWIVFLDGHFAPALSRIAPDSPVRIASLARAIAEDRDNVEPFLTDPDDAASPRTPFADLNTAFLQDGAFVSLPQRAVCEKPVHIVYVATGVAPDRVVSPRTVIRAAAGSQARIVETYVGRPARYFTNAVTRVALDEGAVLDHCRLQREALEAFHVASTHVVMKRGSAYTSHALALGGGLARSDVSILMDGEGADCTLNGLYVVSGDQHVDHHTVVEHARPHGTSRQLYKGVLDGRARGVFDGLVVVRPGAQKTDSRQENRNLILSESALVDTKPTLKINADDVKCSHAATTGQMDETSLFYLRSRAIDPATARRIMIHAFISDVLRRVKVPALREGLDALLFGTGGGEAPALAPEAPGGRP